MSLAFFVQESNRIEGIIRPPTEEELRAHVEFLELKTVTEQDLSRLVYVLSGAKLRTLIGDDVMVGNHYPPPGGPAIREKLGGVLSCVNDKVHPYYVHHMYETLHPFMDGNGRSGRALWAWQMLHQQDSHSFLKYGFLHIFYYQTLQFHRAA